MTEQEIAQFNSKFSPYVGTNVTGVNVNALINSVITSNQAAVREMNGQYVTIAFPTMSDASGGKNVTVGVDTKGADPKIKYGTTDATSASNVATGEQENTDSILRVTAGKTYTVETYEDPTTGLTSKILVKLNK